MLKKLLQLIFNRWTLSIFGLLILGVLIWLFGPLFSFAGNAPLAGETARGATIAVISSAWLVFQLAAWLRRRQINRRMLASLAPVAAPDPRDLAASEERDALNERFTDAIATLKTAHLGGRGGRRYLYQLPWYLLVGPPGSGKTTALANSGLQFPLERTAGKGAIRGVGGTRNCDWFFTDEAVLIDTAGRYTTQDSDEQVDRSAWQDFLQLLRKHRPARPIDGLIVAFSATDLIRFEPEERRHHARAVSRRIQEVYSALEVKAPVYVVFTKCDLVAGFTEYFSDLRSEDRAQVWGITFDLKQSRSPDQAIAHFPSEFNALIERLTGRQLPRIQEARDLRERGAVLMFPQQMLLLRPAVEAFLTEAFAPSRYEAPVLLRGVYFTSATQEGSPIDRVLSAVASQFGLQAPALPASTGHGVSFFLTRLLRDVIFPEAGLVTSTSRLARNRPLLMLASYAGAVLLAVVGTGALLASYLGNVKLIEETKAEVDRIAQAQAASPGGADIGRSMAVLTALRQLPGGYSERGASPPLHLGLGLYQGGRLGAAGDMAYRRALNTLMVPPLMARMEQQIGESFGNPEYLYQALKFYLMMTTPEHRDPELLKVWIARDWEARYPGATTAAFRQSFREHLDALLEDELNPVPAGNPALIAQARQALAQLPLASRVYAQLKAEQRAERTDGWTLAGSVPADDLRYFRRRSNTPFSEGLPRLYTVDGYQQVFVSERDALVGQVVQEAWVLGPGYARSDDERSGLERKVEELYLADYARLWEAFLDDIEMQQGSNVEQQADLVRAIMTPDSPAKTVLAAIAGQTALAQAIASREQQEMDPQQLQRFRDRVGRWLGRADAAASQPVATAGFVDPALKVDQRFRQLHALLQSDGKTPPRIDTALADLADLYDYLVQAMHQKTLGPDAVAGLHEIVARGNAVIGRIESLANAQPQPLRAWLASTAETSRALTIGKAVGGAQQQVKEAWASSVGPECRAALASRYPFDRNAGLFVNLNDFTRLFGPGGVIEGFAQTYILPFADTSVRPWRWRREGAGLRGLSSEALRMFEQAGRIREAFFAQSGGSLGFGFEIEPVSLDHRARQVVLELGDQRITYQHGPRRPTRVEWPQRGPGASITFTTPGLLGQTIMASERGPWAWLKLLDAAHVRRSATPDRFRVLFDVSGYRAEFDVRSDSIINPFFLPELEQFRCLERL